MTARNEGICAISVYYDSALGGLSLYCDFAPWRRTTAHTHARTGFNSGNKTTEALRPHMPRVF
jgi:hypothetical protein